MEQLKHECGVAMIRLLKPLEDYEKKYGTWRYGLNKLYLMMEKQHNRGCSFERIYFNRGPTATSTRSENGWGSNWHRTRLAPTILETGISPAIIPHRAEHVW